MNTSTREQLLTQLLKDNQQGVSRFSLRKTIVVWCLAAWGFVLLATLWVQTMRPNWLQELLSSPHFAIETLSGLLAIILLSTWVFRLGVPASGGRLLLVAGMVALLVWVGSVIVGLQNPALPASMAGKREFCRYEVLIYSLPLLIFGLHFLNRAYVLQWPVSASAMGVVSALIPAWMMQIACMYDPAHIIEGHLIPVVLIAVFACAIGFILGAKRN